MKRLLLLILLTLSALLATAQRDIYQRYASRQDCLVAYQQRHAIDSAHHAAVLLLRAQTDQAWQWMQQEFKVSPSTSDPNLVHIRISGTRDRLDPRKAAPMKGDHIDCERCCFFVLDINDRTLCIYFPERKEDFDAILMKTISSVNPQ